MALLWPGGFEPFGADWNNAAGASLELRLPGQWMDDAWEESSLGAEVYYNVHRFLEVQSGRYTQGDRYIRPSSREPNVFAYVTGNPVTRTDPWGLFQIHDSCDCFGSAGQRMGMNMPQLVAKACAYRKTPGCTKLMSAHTLGPLGQGRPKRENFLDCFSRRCSAAENGKGPLIVCSMNTEQCGWTPPSGDIVLYRGNMTCPRVVQSPTEFSGPRDFSQTLFHEIGHTCGVPEDEPRWWQDLQTVCTGWPL